MLMRFMTLLLSLSIISVSAQAASHDGLKAAFDELNYSLSVEWDQEDQVFYETQVEKFSVAVRKLQSQGLTNAELLGFAKSEIKNAKAAKDLEEALKIIEANKMSANEADHYLHSALEKSYSTGASWEGDDGGIAIIGFAVMAVCLYVFISQQQESKTE